MTQDAHDVNLKGLRVMVIDDSKTIRRTAETLLVREDQTVRQGQKIAEMGSSDADRVKLHFEVRRQGKPIDPLSLLPSR